MGSQQMEAQRSGESIFDILLLPKVLRDAGMTDEVMQAVMTIPAVAKAAADAASHALRFAQKGNAALCTPLYETGLSKREFNVLRRSGVETLGDLALCNEQELRLLRNIGDKAIDIIATLLNAYGISLALEPGNELIRAVTLYGGGDFIPAETMHLWVESLDKASRRYLREYETLGDLSVHSRNEFINWRLHNAPDESLSGVILPQAELLAKGLAAAGLSFYGE